MRLRQAAEDSVVLRRTRFTTSGGATQGSRAQAYYQQALPIVREIGQQRLLVLLLTNLAGTYIRLGDWVTARPHLHEGLTLARHIGTTPEVLGAVGVAGCCQPRGTWSGGWRCWA